MLDAGIRLLEYRNKTGTDAEVLADARVLRAAMLSGEVKLVLDDRVDVALAAGFDGVHVDAGDLPTADARILLGPGRIVGTSASSEAVLQAEMSGPVDYVAFGPIFPTMTKQTSAMPIGIEGVKRFRSIAGTETILVAAAGITLATAPAILEAGADAVAVAAAIFKKDDPAAELQAWLRALK